MKRSVALLLGLIVVAVGVTACNGNVGLTPSVGAGAGAQAAARYAAGSVEEQSAVGTMQIEIQIPRKPASGRLRRGPRYTSPSTRSMALTAGTQKKTFNLLPTSPGCSRDQSTGSLDCSKDIQLPAGTQTIGVTLYDAPKGQGDALSSASTSVKIAAGKTTNVSIVTDGIPARATVLLGSPGSANEQIPQSTPTSVPVEVSAYDAKGNLIIPPGPYATAIVLSDSDTSGATKLSKTKITEPDASVVLKYDGSSAFTSATITPSIGKTAQQTGAAKLSVLAGITEYSIPAPASGASPYPTSITAGADGALWFTLLGASQVGRMTTAGKVSEYAAPSGSQMALGSDKALWYGVSGSGAIVRLSTSGTVTEYSAPSSMSDGVAQLTAGPDKAIWGTDGQQNIVAKISTSGAFTPYALAVPTPPNGTPAPSGSPGAQSKPGAIAAGADGALWLADTISYPNWEYDPNCLCSIMGELNIDRMTTDGVVTEQYTLQQFTPSNRTGFITGMTKGSDGAVWFALGTNVGRITTDGTIMTYPAASTEITGMASGPDGAIWFSECGNPASTPNYIIGRIGTSATKQGHTLAISEYASPTSGSVASSITSGSDHALWFTDQWNSKIGRIPVALAASDAGRRRLVQGRMLIAQRRSIH